MTKALRLPTHTLVIITDKIIITRMLRRKKRNMCIYITWRLRESGEYKDHLNMLSVLHLSKAPFKNGLNFDICLNILSTFVKLCQGTMILIMLRDDEIMQCQTASTTPRQMIRQQVRCVRSGTENNVDRSWQSVSNGKRNVENMLRQSLNEIKLFKRPQNRLSTNIERMLGQMLRQHALKVIIFSCYFIFVRRSCFRWHG